MPIHVLGNQGLKSATNSTVGNGATVLSAQVWVQTNIEGQVTDEPYIFCKEFQTSFAFYFSGTATHLIMRLLFPSADSQTNVTLQVGVPYHLVMTADGTTQKFYINGVLHFTTSIADSLSPSTLKLVVGADAQSGGDYIIDDPAVWSGYALTQDDVKNLRDRVVSPLEVSPENLAYFFSLDGPDGVAAVAGDAGLASQGSVTTDNFSLIHGPPTYTAVPFEYTPSAAISDIRVVASGKTIVVRCADLGGRPANLTTVDVSPTIAVNGGALITLSASLLAGTYTVFPLPAGVTIGSADAVTFTAASDWSITSAGNLGASVDLAVTNAVGQELLPQFALTPKTMPTGYNIEPPHYYSPVIIYANNFRHANDWATSVEATWTTDSDGNPTSATGEIYALVNRNDTPNGFDDNGYPSDPAGDWTLMWDGSGTCVLRMLGGNGTIATKSSTLTGGVDNRIVYTTAKGTPAYYNAITIFLNDGVDVRNIRIYPPGQPTDGSAKFHSDLLRMLAGTKSIRFMDAANTNGSNILDFADWAQPSQITYDHSTSGRNHAATIASVTTYPNTPAVLVDTPGWTPLLFATSADHGFRTGNVVAFSDMSTTITLSDSTQFQANNFSGVVYIPDATSFAIALFTGASSIVGTQTLSGTVKSTVSGAMPLRDMVELCNTVGADMWINVPHAMSDQGVADMAEVIAEGLDPGLKVRVEYSNEHWNSANGFYQNGYFQMLAAPDGLSPSQGYARRACEVHDLFLATLMSHGKGSSLVRVFGAQASFPGGPTTTMVDWLSANGKQIDELAVAPYFNNGPAASDEIWDAMDIDQIMDCGELAILENKSDITMHSVILQAKFPNAKVCCYEGGPEAGSPSATLVGNANSRKWARHPRMRGIMLTHLKILQDHGCSLFNDFSMNLAVQNSRFMWGAYTSTGQLAGLGDGSDGQFDNRTNYEDQYNLVSVVGSAIDQWEALVGLPTAPVRLYLVNDGAGIRLVLLQDAS